MSPLNLTCSVLARIQTANSLSININYMKYRQCSCLPNNYVNFLPMTCIACPPRLTCSRSLVSPLHVVQPGFFPVFTKVNLVASVAYLISSVVNATLCTRLDLPVINERGVFCFTVAARLASNYLRNCQIADNVSERVIQSQLLLLSTSLRCRTTSDCPGITTTDSTSIFSCAIGRNSASLLCSQCIPGYYLTSNRDCHICPSDFQWLAPLINCVLAVVVFVVLWKHSSSKGHRTRAISQITIFWLQVNAVIL